MSGCKFPCAVPRRKLNIAKYQSGGSWWESACLMHFASLVSCPEGKLTSTIINKKLQKSCSWKRHTCVGRWAFLASERHCGKCPGQLDSRRPTEALSPLRNLHLLFFFLVGETTEPKTYHLNYFQCTVPWC